jgi:hypothetical protein
MRINLLLAAFVLLGTSVAFAQAPDNAWDQIAAFAKQHKLDYQVGHDEIDQPFGATLVSYTKGTKDKPSVPKARWDEQGYPTVEAAVAAVERDYKKHKNGYVGVFGHEAPATFHPTPPVTDNL